MTNKEKALDLLVDSFAYQPDLEATVKEAVELASKTDWFYPSKNEFPRECEVVFCRCIKNYSTDATGLNSIVTYRKDGKCHFVNTYKAWCYMPIL